MKNAGENVYDWKCEFCFNLNKNLNIDKNDLPKDETYTHCIQTPETEDESNKNEKDDSSLILYFDIIGSMNSEYNLDNQLKEIYKKEDISRIEMVKSAMQNIIDSLLKNIQI